MFSGVYTGKKHGVCLLSKKLFAFEQKNRDKMDRDVKFISSVEDRPELEPGVVGAAVIVDVLAVQKPSFVYVI